MNATNSQTVFGFWGPTASGRIAGGRGKEKKLRSQVVWRATFSNRLLIFNIEPPDFGWV